MTSSKRPYGSALNWGHEMLYYACYLLVAALLHYVVWYLNKLRTVFYAAFLPWPPPSLLGHPPPELSMP